MHEERHHVLVDPLADERDDVDSLLDSEEEDDEMMHPACRGYGRSHAPAERGRRQQPRGAHHAQDRRFMRGVTGLWSAAASGRRR